MKCESYDSFFLNFANKTKFNIIKALRDKPLTVNQIVQIVNEEQSTISHNLKKLSECKIIEAKQKGRERIYSLNNKTVIPLLDIVEKHVKENCKGRCHK